MMCENQWISSQFLEAMTVGFVSFHRPSEEDALNGKFVSAINKWVVFCISNCLGLLTTDNFELNGHPVVQVALLIFSLRMKF